MQLPAEFVRAMQTQLGHRAESFFEALEQPWTPALRTNPLRTGADAASLPYRESRVPWAEHAWYVRENTRPGASLAHFAGAYYLQEASAAASAAVLNAQPGESVLDLCAAPGGKSTQIAAALCGQGLLVANEPDPARARVLAGNLERLGCANAIVTNAYPQDLSERFALRFDAILCDAPCSGEGMFRRLPEARGEWSQDAPEKCARRQAQILDEAAKMLRPGGRLVYSTCTFNRLEDEDSIEAFLDRHTEFVLQDFRLAGVGASRNGTLRLWPQDIRGDGHFVACLRKSDTRNARLCRKTAARPSKAKPEPSELRACLAFLGNSIGPLPDLWREREAVLQGDQLVLLPKNTPELGGLRICMPGLRLARAGRTHAEPEHALAMALPDDAAARRVELDDDMAQAFCAGQSLPTNAEKGWVRVCWRFLPLGWGKISDGLIKNHLPKGLRREHLMP